MLYLIEIALHDVLNGVPNAWETLDCLLNQYLSDIRYQHYQFSNWIDGEDVLQEVKLRIHRGLEKIKLIPSLEDQNEAIERFCFIVRRVCRQATIDQVRRLKGEDKLMINNLNDEELKAKHESLFIQETHAYKTVLVNELTSTLTSQEYEIIYHYTVEEMSIREIATDLGIDRGKVFRILKSALKKLVKEVSQEKLISDRNNSGKAA